MAIGAAGTALAGAAAPTALLEALTRRFYKIRDLENVRAEVVQNLPIVRAEYVHRDRRLHVVVLRSVMS